MPVCNDQCNLSGIMVTLCTTCFNIKDLFCQRLYVFRIILRINSDYFHKQYKVGLVMEMQCISCDAETDLLYIIHINFMLQRVYS